MTSAVPRTLDLDSLAQGIPVIPEDAAGYYKLSCMVCLSSQNHTSGVRLLAHYDSIGETCEVLWTGEVTDQIQRSFRDENKTTDFGAQAIAFLLVRELTDFTVIEQSNVGTTIDYYLAHKDQQDDTLIFNHAAYLEVTGIRFETEDNSVERRIAQKRQRLRRDEDLPALIVVVEFGQPWAKMVTV